MYKNWYHGHFIEKLIHKNLSKEIKRHSSSSFNKQEWKKSKSFRSFVRSLSSGLGMKNRFRSVNIYMFDAHHLKSTKRRQRCDKNQKLKKEEKLIFAFAFHGGSNLLWHKTLKSIECTKLSNQTHLALFQLCLFQNQKTFENIFHINAGISH